ncbi:MAG: hypothetical protein JW920_01820 [Deltaproteobacteria bacterium]|nr:hypothetical protein [Deltaproteobacteria bacterium]
MPIYEYKCNNCGNIQGILLRGYNDPDDLACDSCGSVDIKRIISRVNYHSSSSDRLNSYDSRARHTDSFYQDTRNIGLHAEQMLKKSGVEPTEDFKAKLEKVRTDPSSILKD